MRRLWASLMCALVLVLAGLVNGWADMWIVDGVRLAAGAPADAAATNREALLYPRSNPSNFVNRTTATQGMQVAGAYLTNLTAWSGSVATQQIQWLEAVVTTNITTNTSIIIVTGAISHTNANNGNYELQGGTVNGSNFWYRAFDMSEMMEWSIWYFNSANHYYIGAQYAYDGTTPANPGWEKGDSNPIGSNWAPYGGASGSLVTSYLLTYPTVTNYVTWRSGFNPSNAAWAVSRDGVVLQSWSATTVKITLPTTTNGLTSGMLWNSNNTVMVKQ